MDLGEFRGTLAQGEPPEGLSFALQTLWWDAKGDWDKAHECAQADHGHGPRIVFSQRSCFLSGRRACAR